MRHPVETKVTLGFGVATAAMLIIGLWAVVSLQKVGEQGRELLAWQQTANRTETLRDVVQDVETTQRVILTGSVVSLLVVLACILKIRSQLRELHKVSLEREQAELALRESNRELESFAYTISHDLRAPLRIMRGFAQVLEEDYGSKWQEEARACVHRISDAARRMDLLIHDLLEYSRLTREKVDLVTVDLNKLFDEVIHEMDHTLQESGAKVRKLDGLAPVLGNPRMLRQTLENLITNAIKFVPPGQTSDVTVRTKTYDHWVRTEVSDNGIGIAPEFHEKIFKVFERLHGIETYPGTGIGLAIVRKASERMGGTCGVESKLGEGSIFWFDLPSLPFGDRS